MTAAGLRRLERVLWAIGVALAAWCAALVIEARFFKTLPVPPPAATRGDGTRGTSGELPGDASTPRPIRPRPAPAAGTVLGKLEAPSIHLAATVLEGSDDATLSRGAGTRC